MCQHDIFILWLFPYHTSFPVSILHKSIAGRYRPVRVADGPITARYRFMQNASWDYSLRFLYVPKDERPLHDIGFGNSDKMITVLSTSLALRFTLKK